MKRGLIQIVLLITVLVSGCAVRILPDVQFGRQGEAYAPTMVVQSPRPVEDRPQQIPFERLVLVQMPWDYPSAAGTVYHTLEHGCGLTAVKAAEPPGEKRGFFLQPKPVPHHKYRLEITISDKQGRESYGVVSYAEATANLFDDTARVSQTAQFVRTGGGVAYYGRGRDALGNPMWVGPQRTYREAAEAAIKQAVQALCYGVGSSHLVGPTVGARIGGYSSGGYDAGGAGLVQQPVQLRR